MNSLMRSFFRTLSAVMFIALVLGLVAGSARAQHPQHDGEPVFNVDFPGGTALDYVDCVRRAIERANLEPANIVAAPELGSIEVPPLQLQAVSIETALNLLTALPPGPHQIAFNMLGAPDGRPVLTLRALTRSRSTRAPSPDTMPRLYVVSLRRVIDSGISSEQALSALEAVLGLASDDDSPPRLRFHEDTAVLAVMGRPDQIEAAASVVSALETSAQAVERARELSNRDSSRRTQEARVAEELAAQTARLREAESERTRLSVALKMLEEELQQARMEADRTRAQRLELESELRKIQEEANTLRGRLHQPQPAER